MDRKPVLLLILLLLVSSSYSQVDLFSRRDKVINMGVGFSSALYKGSSFYTNSVLPLSVSFEKGVRDDILDKGTLGLGGYAAYSAFKYDLTDWGYRYSNFIFGAKGNFHYPLIEVLDTYVGLLIAYNIRTAKGFGDFQGKYYNVLPGGLIWSMVIGGRYYFKDRYAAFAELGTQISYLTFGVSLKLK